jgi:hypothetical protein
MNVSISQSTIHKWDEHRLTPRRYMSAVTQ